MTSYREIIRLVWPLALGMANNAVMQFADRAFLARYSMTALEAVLPAGVLAGILLGFFQSVVGYAGVFVAQSHGAGRPADGVRAYRAALVVALASGLAMLPLLPFGHAVFAATAATDALRADECAYYDVVSLGGLFLYGQMAASAYFTGQGRTRFVFWVNVLGNALNVALDPLLIFGLCGLPRLGIAGAAWATAGAMAAQGVILVAAAERDIRRAAHGTADGGAPLRAVVARLLRFGLPAGGYTVLNMLSFTIFVFVTGRTEDAAFATSNACFTVNYLLAAPVEGIALGVQTLVGQARGRKDDDGAALAVRRTLRVAFAFVGLACAAVLLAQRPILALFAPPDAAARAVFMSLGPVLFALMVTWQFFDAADVVLSGALKGAGDTRFVFVWMLASAFGLWLPLVFAAQRTQASMVGLWLTMIAYVVVLCAGTAWRWKCGRWRKLELTFDSRRQQ